jgi:hypothetical protein
MGNPRENGSGRAREFLDFCGELCNTPDIGCYFHFLNDTTGISPFMELQLVTYRSLIDQVSLEIVSV